MSVCMYVYMYASKNVRGNVLRESRLTIGPPSYKTLIALDIVHMYTNWCNMNNAVVNSAMLELSAARMNVASSSQVGCCCTSSN